MESLNFAPNDWREWRRIRALQLKEQGWFQRHIATALGVTEDAVSRWLVRARNGGPEALRSRTSPGRPPKLSAAQKRLIPEFLWHGAEAYGFRGQVWTCARIAQVIQEELGTRYHHVGRLLRELRWTPQVPIRRAIQRDEDAIRHWREEVWSDLRRQARRERRVLVFEDESGFYLLPGLVRTYAPQAQTPVIRQKQTRDHLSVKPLVGTIVFGRDAFFNITEGESPLLGGGVLYNAATRTVTLDISHLTAGSTATLVARLVNNDDDTTTQVGLLPLINLLSSSPVANPTTTSPLTASTPPRSIDFDHLTDVTASMNLAFRRTSWNEDAGILHAGAVLTNTGTYSIRGPALVAIAGLSEPMVAAYRPDGFLPDGTPYYDVTHLVLSGTGDTFAPGEFGGEFLLRFYNPEQVQFDLELRVLAHINEAPVFVTDPRTEVVAGKLYQYDANAVDSEADALTYSLVAGPSGMSINASGILSWQTGAGDVGEHTVIIRTADPYGGVDLQSFVVSVITGVPNRPPMYLISEPSAGRTVAAVGCQTNVAIG